MKPAAARVVAALEHHAAGRLAEAEALYREALAEEAHNVDALHFLGVIALQRGAPNEAIDLISQALARNPANAPACNNLGLALAKVGRHAEALRATLRALALQADYRDALANLRRLMEAATGSIPEEIDALMVLGDAYGRANALDEAADCMRRILAVEPAAGNAHNLLANVLRNQGLHREAMRHYELALAHDSAPAVVLQNLLFCMQCSPDFSAADIHARHREFARRFEAPLASVPFANPREPERRLRIGYVSPDFRDHVVGHYMQPIFERHDRARVEVHGYSAAPRGDAVTERLAKIADRWHDVHSLPDEALAALVREHGIDVLVDLCGHGPGNRILAFARKPAPVQVSYLDYSATTGLASMDYRLTTAYCDPPGADRYYSEKLVRLPHAYWTYNPSVALPVAASPAQTRGGATFGSFNLYYRVTPDALDVWARLLQAVPGSRLLVVSVAAGSTRQRLLERLASAGVAPERVVVHGMVPYEAYHRLIGETDVALTPWPYNGATTALDCLWNGVPVVAMAGGETFTTRLACSVLDAVGLPELIAGDADDYVRIAATLARAPARLAEMRGTLRRRLERSPLRDFSGFTRALESAYREMWRAWCAT